MAATISTPPTSPAYNGNDLWVELESDLVNIASTGFFDIEMTGSGPTIGQTLTLNWGGESIVFTVAAATNSTATAIPTKGAESLNEYHVRVANAFRENYKLSQAFFIEAHSDERVRLTARTNGLLNLDHTSTLSSTTITVSDGVDPSTEPNLAAYLELWTAAADMNDEVRVTALQGLYNPLTAKVKFNLKGLLPVGPELPAASSIASSISFTWKHGDATKASTAYYLRTADRYGNPAVPEALIKSDVFYGLHGARREDHDNVTLTGTAARKLHGYRTQTGEAFQKPITDVQPDWLYIFANEEMTDCRVEFEILWSDGSITTETPSSTIGTLAAGMAHWIRSTPYDAGAIVPPTTGELPWQYTFRLLGDAGDGEITLAEVNYIIRPCTDWDIYLLLDNGLGGCESVLFRGKTAFGIETSKETARLARTDTFALDAGEIIDFNREGQKTFELSSGWHDLYYIQHLQQMLLGDVWWIDTKLKRFLKLHVESSSMATHEDDGDLYAVNLKVKNAWLDAGHNP